MSDATKIIRSTLTVPVPGEPLQRGPVFAAPYLFLAKSKLLTESTSFGGVTTAAERLTRWGGDAVAEGFIRPSAGCEAIEDLIEDVAQALDAIR